MTNTRKRETVDDSAGQSNGDDFTDASSASSTGDQTSTSTVGSSEIGLTERLTDIFVEEGEGDLLLQRSDREDRVLQWLQALDMQVLGACRADERLKPLLKSKASTGIAEDRLLAHLSQHFEPSEVCILARCFCIPLVSIRVGKISKRGTLLCPSSLRGNLSLYILPSSDLRLSFIGDDGLTERLFTLSCKSECSAVVIDEIPADNSGRSFLIKSPDARVVYFWCSEKSKLLGIELISKMKDLIRRKPSIAELTGISESRLGYLATHLRAYLVGSSLSNGGVGCPSSISPSCVTTSDNAQSSSMSLRSLRPRPSGNQALKSNSLYQGSLSPRSSSFKDGLPRILSSLRNAAREKLRRLEDCYQSAVDNLTVTSPVTADELCSNQSEPDSIPEAKTEAKLSSSFLESLGKLAAPPISSLATQVPPIGLPLFSPYYCWCPQSPSSLQYPAIPPQFPLNSSSESLSVPPLSSLLSANGSSSLLMPTQTCSLSDIPALDFPAFLPDPLVRLQVPGSHPIPTFTPLICDPIVHIPVIDVCSSGQGYLVSGGPAISATIIPPLHSKLVNPLIPESDSMVENGARETLRLLISTSSQTNPPLMNVLPAVLTNANETHGMLVGGSRGLFCRTRDVDANEIQNMFVTGSRGLYCGTRDVDAIGKSVAFVSLSGSSAIGDTVVAKICEDSLEKLDGQTGDEKSSHEEKEE